MSRPTATTTRFMDGVLKILRDDAHANPSAWHKTPATFVRSEFGPHLIKQSFPVVAVVLDDAELRQDDERMMGAQQSAFSFYVLALVEGVDASTAILELDADIRRVLMGNRQLTAVDDPANPTILDGFMVLGATKYNAWTDGSKGEAGAKIGVEIKYVWSAAAP